MEFRKNSNNTLGEQPVRHFRKLWVGLTILLFVAMATSVARAETCYRLQPFSDTLRLNVEITEGATGSAHHLVYGNWISGSYTLPVVGARELNRGSSSVRRLGIHGTNNTAFFGDNPICSLDGIPGGAWRLVCTAGSGARFVNNGSSLAPISCSGVAVSLAEEGGSVAGQ